MVRKRGIKRKIITHESGHVDSIITRIENTLAIPSITMTVIWMFTQSTKISLIVFFTLLILIGWMRFEGGSK